MSKTCLKCLMPLGSSDQQKYGLHIHCFTAWFEVSPTDEFSSLVLRSVSKAPDSERSNENISSFFHGQYRKYSATLGEKNYILKVKQSEAPELPDVEYVCNQIAENLGIPVARFYCVEIFGERAFVTQNFIDKNEHQNLSHVHLHLPKDVKSDCEVLINVISNTTGRYPEIETFIKTCLFDALIGNHDRHGRNLGFIVSPRGTKLAPIYDNPSMLGLEQGEWLAADFAPTGRIPTKSTSDPSIGDYAREFIRLGYCDVVDTFSSTVKYEKIFSLIDKSFCSHGMKAALGKLIEKRIKELDAALSKKSE